MKPHEETWTVRENADGQVFVMCGERVIAEIDGDFPEPALGRAKLAAQAPAMARMLRRISEIEKSQERPGYNTNEIDAVLRDAGVIP